MISYDLDNDTLYEIAVKSLTAPSNAYFWDDRLYETHGAFVSWAERGDDLLEESNYRSALALIQGAAGESAEDHVIDGTSSHWAFGSLRTIYVQIRETAEPCDFQGCDEESHWWREGVETHTQFCEDHRAEYDAEGLPYEPLIPPFTDAFLEAAGIVTALLDYPFVDESDYSDRESQRFEANLDEAVDQAHKLNWEDTDADREAILERAWPDLGELYGQQANAEVSWESVAEIWGEARDAHFSELGNLHLNAQIEGQLLLVAA
ncbi:hypothetical protein KME66_14680 [Streptomyces sp. YPW6]|uniref:hypothetical protein n=1 Tax=Streptomyces sp. YPW6 TaxID=2840373 RepID=UPI001C0B1221|nr:hypothetical protein [Streptomyces sp. YPW6]QWQ42115.1 hypothetical protein KME66_14680 [Streptomyces sp. YPW6]